MTTTDRPDGESVRCRICGGAARDLGIVYHQQPTRIGGIPVDLGETEYHFLQCRQCGFAFKNPLLSEDTLLGCYQRVPESQWGEQPDAHERRFDLIAETAARLGPGGRRVLDIGCANGALLQCFGTEWDRCGVEPSSAAAALAESRGVRVLAPIIDQVPSSEMFDVVLAVDVVEHIPDPIRFFGSVAAHLRPGGVFIIYTGDTDALTWRLEHSRYWYCSIVEHVSFYNRPSLDRIGSRFGLAPIEQRRMSHALTPIGSKAMCIAKNAAFLFGFHCGGFGVPALQRIFLRHHAPSWMTAPDHILLTMRNTAQPGRPAATAEPRHLEVEIPARLSPTSHAARAPR